MNVEVCAEDSTFSVSNSNVDRIAGKLLEKYNVIEDFMCSNQLKLNGDKTHIMLLSTDKSWRSRAVSSFLGALCKEKF